jgi:hypothetical protein
MATFSVGITRAMGASKHSADEECLKLEWMTKVNLQNTVLTKNV